MLDTALHDSHLTAWNHARTEFAWRDYKALLDSGVSSPCLIALLKADNIGADDITIRHRKWERRFRGDRAVVLPVRSPVDGEIMDLIAFRLETPKSYWPLTGSGALLGYGDLIEAERERDASLTVHECPLDWLKAECKGIVIADWRHYWPAYFAHIKTLQTKSVSFGKRLAATLERPLPTPDVQVPVQ